MSDLIGQGAWQLRVTLDSIRNSCDVSYEASMEEDDNDGQNDQDVPVASWTAEIPGGWWCERRAIKSSQRQQLPIPSQAWRCWWYRCIIFLPYLPHLSYMSQAWHGDLCVLPSHHILAIQEAEKINLGKMNQQCKVSSARLQCNL